ncbi:MAG: hypothetical protein H6702_02990 [Myxococcales bacterium]|nr:hypothetical protein [Myxococcales bacterium]
MIDKPDAALRLARTIASDILLYNKDKIAEGLKADRLFEVLESELSEGYELFESRVSADIRAQYNFVDRAIVDVLIKASAHLPTSIW